MTRDPGHRRWQYHARRDWLTKETAMTRRFRDALISISAALVSFPALAQTAAERPGYWHHGWDWGWGHMVFGSLFMVLFWGGIIALIVFTIRWLGGGASGASARPSSKKTALDIFEERFARGEIDKEDFEERKRLLSD
jgi:putative membrane protein